MLLAYEDSKTFRTMWGGKKNEKKKDKFKSYSPLPVLPINLFLKYFSWLQNYAIIRAEI